MEILRPKALLPILWLGLVCGCDNGVGLTPGPINDGLPAGGTNPVPSPAPEPPPETGTVALLASEEGDFIGAGLDYVYSKADSEISIETDGGLLTVIIEGDENWRGEFKLPESYTAIEAGTFPNLTRYPFHDAAVGGLSWSGEGRGCNTLDGSFIIDSVTYDGDTLTEIALSFEQYCGTDLVPLRGVFRYDAADPTVPPGPQAVPADGLWEPPGGATPATGNYIYLASDADDFVGAGLDYLYTDDMATFSVNLENAVVTVDVSSPEDWTGNFIGMNFLDRLEAGYYDDVQRYPFHNQVKGGLDWSGEGRGCNRLNGWFAIDSISYDGDMLSGIELRFEQRCDNDAAALFGKVSWSQ